MFGEDYQIGTLSQGAEMVRAATDSQSFQRVVKGICDYLQKRNYETEVIHTLEARAYFVKNEYSDKNTADQIEEAKGRVLSYIDSLVNIHEDNEILLKVLRNFDLFLDGLFEREPHKKGTILKENLRSIKLQNEYDLQFFLYAYLKPLFPKIRAEVSQDIGYGGPVRPDFLIQNDCAIEVKFTGKNMSIKNLKEQVASDITHYDENNIIFFIYDKEKLIENPDLFRDAYEKKASKKHVYIIIHRPKHL